jgi:hypothetical protein
MAKVLVEYEYHVVAGKAGSTAASIARAAQEYAEQFFGTGHNPQVRAEVKGNPQNYNISCMASCEVEV